MVQSHNIRYRAQPGDEIYHYPLPRVGLRPASWVTHRLWSAHITSLFAGPPCGTTAAELRQEPHT